MKKKNTLWYTLGEAAKATLVPRTRLDHACRVGRVQYRRSETGARLLSHDVIEKLRKEGLKAFPRPYDPIASPNEQEATPPGASGNALAAQRDKVEQKRVEIEEVRVSRELRQLKEQEQQEKAERRAVAAAERQAQAEQRGQAEYQRQRVHLEEARQAEGREQAARDAEARECRRQWEAGWLDLALKLLPCDVPHSFELDVHQAVAELLPRLDGYQPEQLIKRLIQAAIGKVLQPWYRKKEIEKIIDECRKQLPIEVRSWHGTPTEWEARAMQAAANAIAPLGNDASLAEIRAAAALASSKICAEYGTRKGAEDHRRTCEQMAQLTFEGDDARAAVRQALEKLPVGATHTEMQKARDAALAPFRAAKRAAADADRFLQHVSDYIEELGNERTGEWELGNWSKRYDLAAKLKSKLRPLLIQELSKGTLDADEVRDFIEEWVDQELDLKA